MAGHPELLVFRSIQLSWPFDGELAVLDQGNAEERERQQKRIELLTSERRKLLQAHYADALPLDLLKSEQKRISDELEAAERLLHAAEAKMQRVMIAVEHALSLLVDCYHRPTVHNQRQGSAQ